MAYHPHIHHRRSIRLKGYDYSRAGLYFITLCCQDRIHLFGKISNKSMVLNHFGQIVKEEWEKTAKIRKNTALHEYIIMPNHFHAILEILYSKKGELKSGDSGEGSKSDELGELSDKAVTGELPFAPTGSGSDSRESDSGKSLFAPKGSIWQRNYYEHIIRNEKAYQNITNYIIKNPANRKKDTFH